MNGEAFLVEELLPSLPLLKPFWFFFEVIMCTLRNKKRAMEHQVVDRVHRQHHLSLDKATTLYT